MIDEGFNELVKLCELGRVLHVLEVLDLLVRDRVGADGDSGCLAVWRISWRRAMLSFVAEGPTYDTGSCEVPSGYQVGKLLGLPNDPLSLLLYICALYCPSLLLGITYVRLSSRARAAFCVPIVGSLRVPFDPEIDGMPAGAASSPAVAMRFVHSTWKINSLRFES